MSGRLRRVVVVGASVAGLRCSETLRRLGYEDELVLVGEEPHLPYERPPLTKEVLRGERDPETLPLRDTAALARLSLTWHLGCRARALDVRARVVELADGTRLGYDGVVVATGSHPVRPTVPGAQLAGVCTVRTRDDALALRAAFSARARVLVVGAGFIGSEVAANARALGLAVTMVETQPVPLIRTLGPMLGAMVARLHVANGVDLRCATSVTAFHGDGQVQSVQLDDGTAVEADVVVLGVGARPATGWLASSGLAIGDGLRCDARLCAGPPRVVAAGDVANWPHPLFGRIRVEHWTNALDHGAIAARTLLDPATEQGYTGIPYMWSEFYGTRLHMVGTPGHAVVRHGSVAQGRLVVLFGRDGRLCGAAAVNWPRPLMHYRALIAASASWADALTSEPAGI